MINKIVFIVFILLALNIVSALQRNHKLPRSHSKQKSSLKLVHAIFRHGNRNPNKGSLWKGNRYADENYYPEGWGQLTNEGKMTSYKLGQFFRERYDSFLGDIWNMDYAEIISTDINRTKMSGQLVMAGLWPPKGINIWNKDLLWQPIPYNVQTDNKLLLGFVNNSVFKSEIIKLYGSSEIQEYLATKYNKTMQVMNKYTGCSTTDYVIAMTYYDVIKVQDDLGLQKEEWMNQVYPDPLKSLTVDMYYIGTNSTTIKRMLIGPLLEKILKDTQNLINGTLSPSTRKMFAYSGHDINIGTMYVSMAGTPMTQPPPYGSSIIFEVHKLKKVWGFKIFMVDYTKGSPHRLSISGCRHFCPFNKFYSLVEKILPLV